MSKFFKALENAERERETQRPTAMAPELAAPGEPAAETVDAAAGRVPATATAATRTAAPAVTTAPPAITTAPPPVTKTPDPVTPAAAPSVFARPRATPQPPVAAPRPAYGAPTRREVSSSASHHRAFGGLLEPAPVIEPGELDDHLVSLLAPTSLAAEQYRTVRLHIENLRRERDVRMVAISSPTRGDGKTISAINVAGALAQAPDARVALVETDVRHPGVARALGLPASRGLSGYLLDHAMTVDGVLERPSGVGFAIVVAGAASSMPYELLKSPRLRALFAALRERFDFVVVDMPPILPFPDVGLVRDLVDVFLLVVRANRTPREMVRDSLGAVGADRVLGVIFNDDERPGMDGDEAGWRSYLARPLGGSRAA